MPVNPPSWRNDTVLPLPNDVVANAWAVDAACSGNPGPMEYQCIDLQTGAQVFHYGAYPRHQQHRRVSRHRPRHRPDAAEGHYRQDNL